MAPTVRWEAAVIGHRRRWSIAQAAVSLVLLSAAAMLGGSLRNLEHQNFGFDPDGRYLVSINIAYAVEL